MWNLERIGKLKKGTMAAQRLGIGFEKLDRAVFEPERAYKKLEQLGVKWVRLQSGWARTEKEHGVYDFSWLDDIVDTLLRFGMQPWICLCYGNALYDDYAKSIFWRRRLSANIYRGTEICMERVCHSDCRPFQWQGTSF